jgi:Rab GDP dissociation inhibitor
MFLQKMPFSQVVKKFDLEPNTVDFVGHAVALYTNDEFMDRPAPETIDRIKLYMDSIGRYGDSPFIYPIYGLGGIPEGFSRMAAVNGGTFMLNADLDEVLFSEGRVVGVKSAKIKELMGFDQINCKMIICDPTYVLKAGLSGKVKVISRVVRCICILNHLIPNTKEVPSV